MFLMLTLSVSLCMADIYVQDNNYDFICVLDNQMHFKRQLDDLQLVTKWNSPLMR